MLLISMRAILFSCILGMILSLYSCGTVKKGCPTNGANVGAEKILSGDPKTMKNIKKGKSFRLNKF